MNKIEKNGKKAIGIAMAVIMIASIFAMVAPAFGQRDVPVPDGKLGIFYLDPDNSSIPEGYCHTTEVQLRVNTSYAIQGGKVTLVYDPSCGNITGFAFDSEWETTTGPVFYDAGSLRECILTFYNEPSGVPTDLPADDYHIGNFTVHCNTTTCCKTDLTFKPGISNTNLFNLSGDQPFATDDGTFKCGTPKLDVNKTVWSKPIGDPDYGSGEWVNDIPDANLSDVYRFRCEMHAICCNYTNVTIKDVLSPSLQYGNNEAYSGVWPSYTKTEYPGNNTVVWVLDSSWVWPKCHTLTLEYDAQVIDYGYDCNVQNVTAKCIESWFPDYVGEYLSGEDNACVYAPPTGPNLNVTRIDVNRDVKYLRIADDKGQGEVAFGPTDHTGAKTQCNNISADIIELNALDTGEFNVSFKVDGNEICNFTTSNLNDSSRRVWCNCSWYPLVGDYTINVTADCNSTVAESHENDNVGSRDVKAVQHGTKGNHWQDGRNISQLQCHAQDTINLVHSVGDSETQSGGGIHWGNYSGNWTASDLPVPSGATIKKARLYAYYNFDRSPAQNATDFFTMYFNDQVVPEDEMYSDRKNPSGFGSSGAGGTYPMNSYNFKYGMLAYNVTDEFILGDNHATLNNTESGVACYYGTCYVSMTGMLLVVVYEHPGEPERIICLSEGFDMLKSGNYTWRDIGVTSEEATTYANFTNENIPADGMAMLTTVTNHGWGKTGDSGIYFNGNLLGQIGPYKDDTEIGIREDLVPCQPNDNTVTYRSIDDGGKYGGHWFEATNAFLVTGAPTISVTFSPENELIVQPQEQFDANITIETPTKISSVEYYLHYNTSVVYAETVNKGPFLGNYSETTVQYTDIDRVNGIVSYAEFRHGDTGVSGKGTLSKIHFTTIGERGDMSHLNLTGVIMVKEDKNVTAYIVENGTVTINNNIPPNAKGLSKHEFNNVAMKYPCNTIICSCSYDDNHPGKGGNITYIRWAFGDGQYGTLEGLPDENNCTCKNHTYQSWMWNTSIDDYDPFTVHLTVTDDGCPEETSTTSFPVTVYIAGDANGDGKVNILDGAYVGKHWNECCCGSCPCYPDPCNETLSDCMDPLWTVEQADKSDLNNDCNVNILDAMITGANWGHVAW